MGLKSLIKRTTKGSPLTHTEVDDNWQAIEDTFQTPTDSDIGKVPVLKSDKTGFEYTSLPTIPPFLKSGGASWSGTGLVYDVTVLEYYFNGDKITSATQVTLDASDPDDNRLDAIVVDESGVISVITGTAASSPITPPIPENQLLVQYILVEAGTTEPVIAKEDIYLENAEWTTSTYTTGTATGSIDFDNAVSPKQGVKCISANADARLGARFVRTTSFDPYQYTMLSLWVRFTGSNVATNKSLNVRFENGAGTLVANTINLFNFGLQRNLLNVWQLVVIPITSFGTLPTSVKGLKIIMTGGTVGQARQWDIDLISLTDNSVPSINEQAFNILKDGTLVGQSSSLNFKGAAVNVTNDPINKKVDVEVIVRSPAIVVPITEDYEFSVSDVNKLLYVAAPDITLTMPDPFPFALLDKVYVFPNVNTKMQVVNSAPAIELPDVSTGSNPFLTCISIGTLLIPDFGIMSVGARTLELSKYLYENVTRSIEVNSDDQPISNGVPYGLIDIEVPLGDAVGGSVTVTTTVTDGTDVQVVTDNITYTAINVGGTITGDVDVAISSNTLSSGTLSTSYTISQNGSNAALIITATSSLTPTLIKTNAKIINSTNSKI